MHRHSSSANDALPYVIIVVAGVVLSLLLAYFDAFERLYSFTRAYEHWEVDEVVIATFSTLLGLLAVLAVRLHRESERRQLEQDRLHSLVRRDAVTSLPNQVQLDEELLRRVGGAASGSDRFVLILAELSGLDRVSDLYGQATADGLVKDFGERLNRVADTQTRQDLVARLRDGSFALIVSSNAGMRAAGNIIERVIDEVSSLETSQGLPGGLSASFGVTAFPNDGTTPDALLRNAGVAVHRAKTTGKNAAVFYDAAMDEEQRQLAALTADIRVALKEEQFEPYFQPVISLETGDLIGFEALARWVHPSRGVIGPGAFITAAEEVGIIGELFECLFKKVCLTARSWPSEIKVSVNVSPVQLADDRFVDKLLASIKAHDLKPDGLVLEITENAVVRDMSAAAEAMKRLRAFGIRFALDDFGTGYSSLTYLSQLPFNTVKIDKSFVADCHRVHSGRAIVESTISLCNSLGLKTVGEGIETRDEAATLQELGCSFGQGYWFCKPVPAGIATGLISKWKDQPARGRKTITQNGPLFQI